MLRVNVADNITRALGINKLVATLGTSCVDYLTLPRTHSHILPSHGINLSALRQTFGTDPLNTILGPDPMGMLLESEITLIFNRNHCLKNCGYKPDISLF